MNHVCIIAEAGVNHNGSLEVAKKMVLAAKAAGVDYIKFQTFVPKKLVSKYAAKADYQKQTTDANESQLKMLEKLAMTQNDFIELKDYCEKCGVGFISTPFDLDSICFLDKLNMDFWKVPSGEITNLPYLEAIARTGRDVVMSTGMCNMDEIKEAVEVLEQNGTKSIALLHCNTQYPTPFEDVNLKAMLHIQAETSKVVGYSDHTVGIEVPVAAVALGAQIIEKHFTLDKNMDGPDHKASLEPDELKAMVLAIRNIEQALGNGIKEMSASEKQNAPIARKSIVAACHIHKGELFTPKNITTKRPGSGISPMQWHKVLGQVAIRDFLEDELIEL